VADRLALEAVGVGALINGDAVPMQNHGPEDAPLPGNARRDQSNPAENAAKAHKALKPAGGTLERDRAESDSETKSRKEKCNNKGRQRVADGLPPEGRRQICGNHQHKSGNWAPRSTPRRKLVDRAAECE
jgi:hypothetical protein